MIDFFAGILRFFRRGWKTPAGHARRRWANFDKVIAVTGSAGKSCTTRLIGHCLRTQARANVAFGANVFSAIVSGLATSPVNAKFWVQEVSGQSAADLRQSADFLRHNVAVITRIEFDHISVHKDLDTTAKSKGQLVEALDEDGLMVLNADDARVLAMRDLSKARVVTFGRSEAADIHVVDYTDGLPARLAITVTDGDQIATIQTRYAGSRWIPNYLAAVACGTALGIPLHQCAMALNGTGAELFKDSIHEWNEITFMLDTYKSPNWTIPTSLEIVAEANFQRKIMIFGTISDYLGSAGKKYIKAARQALEVADLVLFYGANSAHVRKLVPAFEGRLRTFETYDEVHRYLRQTLGAGDFVYAKASGADHLERILFSAQFARICIRDRCGRKKACAVCRHLPASRRPLAGRIYRSAIRQS